MTQPPRDSEQRILRLLEVSEAAMQAARIQHDSALEDALEEREHLLAELWGLDASEPLPAFSKELAAKQRPDLSGVGPALIEKLRRMDRRLLTALDAHYQRLKEDDQKLARGSRYMAGIRANTAARMGKRLDTTG